MNCSFCGEPIERSGRIELFRNGEVRERYCRYACARLAAQDESRSWSAMYAPDIPPNKYKCDA